MIFLLSHKNIKYIIVCKYVITLLKIFSGHLGTTNMSKGGRKIAKIDQIVN